MSVVITQIENGSLEMHEIRVVHRKLVAAIHMMSERDSAGFGQSWKQDYREKYWTIKEKKTKHSISVICNLMKFWFLVENYCVIFNV